MRNTKTLITEYEALLNGDTQSPLGGQRLDEIAEILITKAEDGDTAAARWVEQYA